MIDKLFLCNSQYITLYILERQKCVNFWPSRGVVGFSGFRGEDLTRDGEKIQEGLSPPSELCFGTSEIECSASSSWSYIMYTFLTLL